MSDLLYAVIKFRNYWKVVLIYHTNTTWEFIFSVMLEFAKISNLTWESYLVEIAILMTGLSMV